MAPLTGKRVLIIGGSSGIGFAVTQACLREGAHVIIASSSQGKLDAAKDRLQGGKNVSVEVVDVSKEDDVKALFERVVQVDHLVYTAGETILGKDTATMDVEGLKSLLDVRYFGVILCARHSKGRITESITTTSSSYAFRPAKGYSEMMASFGAQITTAKALALDLAPIRVNCVAPGLVVTEIFDRIPGAIHDTLLTGHAERMPVGHSGTPEEVAEAYLFAMKCSYFTGQTVVVDGGDTLV